MPSLDRPRRPHPRRRRQRAALALSVLALAALALPRLLPDDTGAQAAPPLPAAPSAEPLPPLVLPGTPPLPPEAVGLNQIDPARWPRTTFGALRLWDSETMWSQVEPAKGQFDWSRLDAYVAAAEQRGVRVLLTLGQSPQWASAQPTDTSPYGGITTPAPPAHDEDWTAYVSAVATRYAGRIEAYETWNEPNLRMFYSGTPERLAHLSRLTAQAVRAADPRALVVTPGIAWTSRTGPTWMGAFLAAGGAEGADVVAYHSYPHPGWSPEQLGDTTADLRRLVEQHAPGLPLWNTETGWGHTSPTDPAPWLVPEAESAALVARTHLALVAAGVLRLYWYGWTNKAVGLWLTADDAVTPNRGGVAYDQTARWLVGARPGAYGPVPVAGGELWRMELGYDDLEGGAAFAQVWWVQSGALELPAPERSVELRRLDGTRVPLQPGARVPVSPEPVLLVQR